MRKSVIGLILTIIGAVIIFITGYLFIMNLFLQRLIIFM